jgi:Family of unknown function (DUF6632)
LNPVMRLRFLRIALLLVGLFFVCGLIPLAQAWWPSGGHFPPNHHEFEQMLASVYVALGVFLFIAVRHPSRHLSLIWFTVWSSFAHASVMALQGWNAVPSGRADFFEASAIFVAVAILLAVFTPRAAPASAP